MPDIDIRESSLRRYGALLDILLFDRTTRKNIIWATDSYSNYGQEFAPKKQVKTELITADFRNLIRPRAAKGRAEQRRRTKEKGEVYTPLAVVNRMNKLIDANSQFRKVDESNWQDFVKDLRIEITCGEAPFIVSRYNPATYTRKLRKLRRRVGFLDKKLREVSKYCKKREDWIFWAKEAYKASYGYEWQGDNVLLARENLLYTLFDYYKAMFGRRPPLSVQLEFAEIISWNIFQMDGLKYVVPMSCHHENKIIPGEHALFWDTPEKVEEHECEGCKFNRPLRHNGKYVRIKDWKVNKTIKFIQLLNLNKVSHYE